MYIKSAKLTNFRMHTSTTVEFHRETTILVGRNNCGKTSVAELFRFFRKGQRAGGRSAFSLSDFSKSVHSKLLALAQSGDVEKHKEVPSIGLLIEVAYEADTEEMALLSNFIVDLEMDCNVVNIQMSYRLSDSGRTQFFGDKSTDMYELEKRIEKSFEICVEAVDPTDAENRAQRTLSQVFECINFGFIDASRPVDAAHGHEPDTLGRLLGDLFVAHRDSDTTRLGPATVIEDQVREMEASVNEVFSRQLSGRILPSLRQLGYPLNTDGTLTTKTTMNAERLLRTSTSLYFQDELSAADENQWPLPEGYNGLGYRNLIYLLLQMHAFHAQLQVRGPSRSLSMLFIEEPEAHLHPQLEELFVRHIWSVYRLICDGKRWDLQVTITTHSSHIANEVPFEQIRYVLRRPSSEPGCWHADVKSLGSYSEDKTNRNWLTQYLTLTKCNLFFADKAVLIEGTSERILLPAFIRHLDANAGDEVVSSLSLQQIALIEVGGAFAHRFYRLLDFIEIPCLIITDIDAVDTGRNATVVSSGTRSSNACINEWFSNPTIVELLGRTPEEKVRRGTLRRVAYQIPEGDHGPCGRTLEDAILLANRSLETPASTGLETNEELEEWADRAAKRTGKTEFALRLIEVVGGEGFVVPRYIREGLEWLRDSPMILSAPDCDTSSSIIELARA